MWKWGNSTYTIISLPTSPHPIPTPFPRLLRVEALFTPFLCAGVKPRLSHVLGYVTLGKDLTCFSPSSFIYKEGDS